MVAVISEERLGELRGMSIDPIKHFINGQFASGSDDQWFETLNPATNDPITTVASGSAADIDRAVKAAQKAFKNTGWAQNFEERARVLRRLADLIDEHADELAYLETIDTGLPLTTTRRGLMPRVAANFRFFADRADQLIGSSYLKGSFTNYTVRLPVGVAGLITPWNVPLMLETWKLAPALSAGNTVVLKPAEWSPLTANRFAELTLQAGFPDGVVNVVHGYGEPTGEALVKHPGVDIISFTGETETGKIIIKNGAEHLRKYSMELGGKSPVIIFDDARLDRAVDAAMYGIFSLNGERCTAGSRLFVQESIYQQVVDELLERVPKVVVGDPFDERTNIGPLIHPEHWQRVNGYMEVAREDGATIATGGGRPEGLEKGNYFEATLLTGVTNDMRVAQEEIFGPVLCVMPFKTEEEALQLANNVEYGLAGYVWTQDVQRAHRVSQQLEAGLIWVNSQNVRDLRTPFGGMKHSGIGREGGEDSFEFYTEEKTIHLALGDHRIPRLGVDDSGRAN